MTRTPKVVETISNNIKENSPNYIPIFFLFISIFRVAAEVISQVNINKVKSKQNKKID